jgi:Skp family chaperone for outer membrane proteins
MKEVEQKRELEMKKHDQKLLDEMKEMKEVEQKRELEMKEHEQTLLDEMQRMKESEASMMKYQLAMLFGGCLFASFAIIQMMRRQNN